MRGLPRRLGNGHQQPQQHPLEHVGGHDRHRRRGEHHGLTPVLPPQRKPLLHRDQLAAGMHQYAGQRRERHHAQRRRERRREDQQPHPVQHPRGLRPRPGVHIRGAADDHRGHRQRAQQPADRVARALGHQLLVVVGLRPVVQPVHGGRAEQRLRRRDQGERQHGAQCTGHRPRLHQPQEVRAARRLDDVQQARHLDPGHRQIQHEHHGRRQRHRHQRRRHHPRRPPPLRPQHQHRDGAHADRQLGPAAGRLGIHQGVQLPGDQHQSDTCQHPLDDRHGNGPEPAPQVQRPHGQLKHPGDQHQCAQRAESVLLHGLVDQHGQPRGRAADLEAAAGE